MAEIESKWETRRTKLRTNNSMIYETRTELMQRREQLSEYLLHFCIVTLSCISDDLIRTVYSRASVLHEGSSKTMSALIVSYFL
jgi:hypothetical protein